MRGENTVREDRRILYQTADILCPLCEKHHWHERDALDLFFGNRFDHQLEHEDPAILSAELESLGSNLVPVSKPVAAGGTFGDGIYAVMDVLLEFRWKYDVPLDVSYFRFRDTKEFDYLMQNAVIDSQYNSVELPGIIERRLCKLCHVKAINA